MQELFTLLTAGLGGNQFFQGAVGAAVLGGTLMYLKTTILSGWNLLLRLTSVSVTVNNEDYENYNNIHKWLLSNSLHKSIRNIEVVARYNDDRPQIGSNSSVNDSKYVEFLTSSDYYFTTYKCLPVKITFSSKTSEMNKEVKRNTTLTFYFRSAKFIKRIQEDISKFVSESKKTERTLSIKKFVAKPFDWNYTTTSLKDISTIFLPKNQIELIKKDLIMFMENKKTYDKLGKPYKRNYLLVGPPGTGKSSLARAIASEFKGYMSLILTNGNEQDFLQSVNSSVSGVLLMEDIDCTKIDTNRDTDKEERPVSLSALLNVLDGPQSIENSISILTTNDPGKLDPAILRSGRMDKVIHLGYLNEEELKEAIDFFNKLMDINLTREQFNIPIHTYGEESGYRPSDVSEEVFKLVTAGKK